MTVADVVADGLVRAGIARFFALRGAAAGSPREALERRALPSVEVTRASHACVMAAVSGGLAGVPGAVTLVDASGDALDGLAWALSHRLPLVALTASAPSGLASVTKATLSPSAGSAAHWIAHASQLAMKEPWGPVHLDVPRDVAVAASLPVATNCRPVPLPAPDPAALDAAGHLRGGAPRPLVVAGRLCRSDADAVWVRAFAEARPAPVLTTAGGRGVLPDPHPLVIGTLGGGPAERELLDAADLIVAIAVDPAELSPGVLASRTAVLTLSPVVPDAAAPPAPATVVGEVGSILEELAPRLRDRRYAEWDVARLHALKQAAAASAVAGPRRDTSRVVEAVRRLMPAGTIAVFEGGAAAETARAWQAVAPGECLIAERFAVAAAAGAQLARPERRVVCFVDGPDVAVEAVVETGLAVLIVSLGGTPRAGGVLPPALRVFASASLATLPAVLDAAGAAGGPVLATVSLSR